MLQVKIIKSISNNNNKNENYRHSHKPIKKSVKSACKWLKDNCVGLTNFNNNYQKLNICNNIITN